MPTETMDGAKASPDASRAADAKAGVIAALEAALPAGAVLTDAAGLFVYESDGFTIAKARPRAVVFPTTLDEVIAVVKLLAERDVQIVPRGSGTGLAGGCVAFEQ